MLKLVGCSCLSPDEQSMLPAYCRRASLQKPDWFAAKNLTASRQWADGSESMARKVSRASRRAFEARQTGTLRRSDGDFGLSCAEL